MTGELRLDDKAIPIKATVITQLYYRQEFGTDMTSDFLGFISGFLAVFPEARGKSLSSLSGMVLEADNLTSDDLAHLGINTLGVLQLAWAMAKTCSPSRMSWPPFTAWLESLGDVDVLDDGFISAVFEVAADGLFRRAGKPVKG